MSYDIVTIGSATVDYYADTDSELISIETSISSEKLLAFPLGGKLLIRELNVTTGGGGTNTAVAFARLGFNTAYLGKVGADSLSVGGGQGKAVAGLTGKVGGGAQVR